MKNCFLVLSFLLASINFCFSQVQQNNFTGNGETHANNILKKNSGDGFFLQLCINPYTPSRKNYLVDLNSDLDSIGTIQIRDSIQIQNMRQFKSGSFVYVFDSSCFSYLILTEDNSTKERKRIRLDSSTSHTSGNTIMYDLYYYSFEIND